MPHLQVHRKVLHLLELCIQVVGQAHLRAGKRRGGMQKLNAEAGEAKRPLRSSWQPDKPSVHRQYDRRYSRPTHQQDWVLEQYLGTGALL